MIYVVKSNKTSDAIMLIFTLLIIAIVGWRFELFLASEWQHARKS